MRKIDLIVIHCSATCEDRPFTGQALEAAHPDVDLMARAIISTSAVTDKS